MLTRHDGLRELFQAVLIFIDAHNTPMSKEKLFDSPVKTVILTWLLAGTADALSAIIVYQIPAMNIFRYIASGVFGQAALTGGLPMVFWGVFFHYFIAFSWVLLFFLLYPRIATISSNRIVNAILYGAVIWIVMNLIVVPLSSVSRGPHTVKSAAIGMAILIIAIALPTSLFISRYYRRSH